MAHSSAERAEQILDQEFPVLDKGFVRLVDYMGSDDRIVQSARVSYGSGTKSYRQDQGLIDYLLRNEHTSPFEQVVLTFHAKMPIFVARQWVRHRTARLNEISGRYSVMKDEFYLPAGKDIAFQSEDNKQGRQSEAVDPELQERISKDLEDRQSQAYKAYSELIDRGLARELARINLPLSLYTEWYWQIDLHNLFHFLRLRLDPHAQYEIRAYAEAMLEIAEAVAPMATKSFRDHLLGGVRFSARELDALNTLLGIEAGAPVLPETITARLDEMGMKDREKQRLIAKLSERRQM
jgi:thymidylate synthase (FAD)